MCKLNEDFAGTNMRFYLHNNFLHVNNSGVYSEPQSNDNSLRSRKVAKAVNIFITDKATPQGDLGTILGYYNPGGDYVVLIKSGSNRPHQYVESRGRTFFSLRHTFNGWENDPWNAAKYGDTIQSRFTLVRCRNRIYE
ncbi:MAG: hypothetical protein IPN97_09965 [Saprospiraceae bacterium]|nr:hypothetical protein [Saprospiraceae bacterium]